MSPEQEELLRRLALSDEGATGAALVTTSGASDPAFGTIAATRPGPSYCTS